MHVSLAGIEHKVQAGMLVSQIFKSVCTSEQSDQILSLASQFLPIDRPSKSDQTTWMGTHVKLYLLLDTGSNNWAATREKTCLRGLRQSKTQTSLLSYRDYLEN